VGSASASPANEVWTRARRVAEVAVVTGLRAISVHAEDVGRPDSSATPGAERTTDVTIEISTDYQAARKRLLYEVVFAMESPPSRKFPGASVRVAYRVFVRLSRPLPFDEQELVAFGASTIAMTTYPFFREACQSLTARLGRPPTTLGLLTTPLHDGLRDQS
jgi:hypothetical protein